MGDIGMYMENIDEFINDENKVVTYKWLSIQLSIPCNTAKRLLHHFVTTQDKEGAKEPLHVTYLVIGSASSKDGLQQTKVLVVPQSKLEDTKQALSAVSCVHVYSVSKSCLKDTASTLYTTDYDCVRQNLASASQFGGIKCPEAKARSDADIASLRKDAIYRPSTPQDTRKAPDPRLVKPAESVKQGGVKAAADGDGKKTKAAAGSDKGKAGAKGSLANMFAAQKTVKKEPKEKEAAEEKVKAEPNNNKNSPAGKKSATDKKAGRISGFFTKGANPREVEVKKEKQEDSPVRRSPRKSSVVKKEEIETESEEEPVVEPIKSKKSKKESPVQKSPPKKSPPKKQSTKRANKGRPNRSRLMFLDSDSSAEEDEQSGSESPVPPPSPPPALNVASSDEDEETPEPQPAAPRAAASDRGKKRKLVETTFADEDGFLVTKKEYQEVTDSESEEPEPPAPKKQDRSKTPPPKQKEENTSPKSSPSKKSDGKPAKKAPAKKSKPSPAKGKQASIMSFFKKK